MRNRSFTMEYLNMQVFLTGAPGYIGTAVADRLTAAGIRPVRGDFSDPKSVGSAARSADGVISLATTYNPAVDGPAMGTAFDGRAFSFGA